MFSQLRKDGRVVAIDADTSFGKLAARSYWDLAGPADEQLDTFADSRTRLSKNTVCQHHLSTSLTIV
jgi:hypothetical protein